MRSRNQVPCCVQQCGPPYLQAKRLRNVIHPIILHLLGQLRLTSTSSFVVIVTVIFITVIIITVIAAVIAKATRDWDGGAAAVTAAIAETNSAVRARASWRCAWQ